MAVRRPKYLTDVALFHFTKWAKENLGLKPDQLTQMVQDMHPVGSYYWSSKNDKSPAQLFGGTWQPVTDGRFLYAYTSTTTGGSSSVSLTSSHMPSHSHGSLSHSHTASSHHHGTSTHTHSISNTAHTHTGKHNDHQFQINGAGGHSIILSGRDFNVFKNFWNSRVSRESNNGSGTFSLNSTTISANTDNTKATVANGGGGTSGGASNTSTESAGSGSASVTLNPSYINAYCWYRSG